MFNVKDWTLNAGFFTENEIWDYKESIPSRLDNTEERWAEIAKDVISFYNNQGGIIVFGITDNYRVIRTITQIDSKKFTDKLRKYIGDKIWIDYHRLGIQEDQSYIGLALIPPRGR
jgi:predicted HTH transcriptional regulator